MNHIIDFHTHCFADELADRAISFLSSTTEEIEPYLDGRVSSLIGSMDEAGIEKSVICPIATKPAQYKGILQWCQQIRSERIIPFPSIHPDDESAIEQLEEIHQAGFKGIKLHPYYQDFYLNEAKMLPIYSKSAELGLMIAMHTGFDFAFERVRRADAAMIVEVMTKLPTLKLMTTHLGGWQDWDEVEKHIIGRPVYMEISLSLDYLPKEKARQMILAHPAEYILFGTDSPWKCQKTAIELLKDLELGQTREQMIFYDNAKRLLDI